MPEPFDSRVLVAAERAFKTHGFVSFVDVMIGIGFLAESNLKVWRLGRIPTIADLLQGGPPKLNRAVELLRQFAREHGPVEPEARFTRQTPRGEEDLQIAPEGLEDKAQYLKLRWMPEHFADENHERKVQKAERATDPVAFIVSRDSKCSECGVEIEQGDMLYMDANEPLCLACAGMGELEFLPAGDTALTRRSTKYSSRKIVVVKFSRSRGRYERQGILAEADAIAKAEEECAEDADERAADRAKAEKHRVQQDKRFAAEFTRAVLDLFPRCPPDQAQRIAQHTAVRGSGRVGRSAAGRAFDREAVTLAVRAAVRHELTNYDELLAKGVERADARAKVADKIEKIVDRWRGES